MTSVAVAARAARVTSSTSASWGSLAPSRTASSNVCSAGDGVWWTSSSRGTLRSPTTAVDDLVEGTPVGLHDRRQRTVARVAEADHVRRGVAVGEAEDAARRLLVADRRVAAADAQVGGGQHHGVRRLAEV